MLLGRFKFHLLTTILFVFTALPAQAKNFVVQKYADSKSASALKVLFIGNSFTYYWDMPLIFAELVAGEDPKRELKVYEAVMGGVTLQDLWQGKVQDVIKKDGPWDFVVLQEQSRRPFEDAQKMYAFSRLLNEFGKKAGARTAFFETWADKATPENQKKLTDSYKTIAQECGAIVVPVGQAFTAASLKAPEINIYEPDLHHSSLPGSYLAACVFYAKLTGKNPQGLPFQMRIVEPSTGLDKPLVSTISERDARLLQLIAWQTVCDQK